MDNMKISAILYSIVAIIFILCAATGGSPAFYGGAAAFIALATAVVANFATTELSFANSSCRAFLICFRYMIAIFINVFRLCTFRTITDNTKSLKLFSLWFYNIAFINEDHWFRGNESLYDVEIRSSCRGRSSC